MGGKTQTSTQTNTPPKWISDKIQGLFNRANDTSKTPYQPYTGQMVAGVNQTQQAATSGFGGIGAATNPYFQNAQNFANQSAADVNPMAYSAEALQPYYNPYQEQVTNATIANLNETQQQQQNDLMSNQIMRGSFGGDRAGVGKAALARNQGLAAGQTLAELNAGMFQNAQNQFNTTRGLDMAAQEGNRAREAAAGQAMSGIGTSMADIGLASAQGLATQGNRYQDTEQAKNTAAYELFKGQQAYPFEQLSWLSNIYGLSPAAGGKTTSQQPGPSIWNSILGAGATILGGVLSDRRAKSDERQVGMTFDGQPIYVYNKVGKSGPEMGLMADEVETRHPEAVGEGPGGLKFVNYGLATSDAAKRGGFAAGGRTYRETPYTGGDDPEFSYIPDEESISGIVPIRPLEPIVIGGGLGAPAAAQDGREASGATGIAPPPSAASAGRSRPRLGMGKISDELQLALISAGLATMGSSSPHAGVAIGQGGLAGVNAYLAAQDRADEQATPYSDEAKIMSDVRNGLITQEQGAAAIARARASNAPSAPTTRTVVQEDGTKTYQQWDAARASWVDTGMVAERPTPTYREGRPGQILRIDPDGAITDVTPTSTGEGAAPMFGGNSVDAQGLNWLVENRILNPQQAAEVAAGKTVTAADGKVYFFRASDLAGPAQGPVSADNVTQPTAVGIEAPGPRELTGQRIPDATRTNAATVQRAFDTLMPALDNYERLIRQYGVSAIPGTIERDLIDQARTDLQLQLKDLNTLGALTGPDLQLMEQLVIDPSIRDVKSLVTVGIPNLLTGGQNIQDRTTASLAQLRSQITGRRDAAIAGLGQTPPSAPTTAVPPVIGEVRDGYRYVGGDPANPQSWEPAN